MRYLSLLAAALALAGCAVEPSYTHVQGAGDYYVGRSAYGDADTVIDYGRSWSPTWWGPGFVTNPWYYAPPPVIVVPEPTRRPPPRRDRKLGIEPDERARPPADMARPGHPPAAARAAPAPAPRAVPERRRRHDDGGMRP
ncbi:MAG: hypothetical protein ABFC67_12215 [Mizugakiibacter sp.]|uniref:hypothetical protein n=1 Tax=Mizugakiibacter sp. TaxID=1972610 RepID=UPI0031C22E20|nr:hypothetical protein [Xanthomonadaceae bacterium]